MKRFLIYLVVVPVLVGGVMASTGQLTLADFYPELAATTWPSNTPKKQGGTIPGGANLSIDKFASNNPAPLGVPVTYTIVITNNGPNNADGVILSDALPPNVTYQGLATPSQGACTGTLIVVCNLATINSGFTATTTIVVTPTTGLSITNVAYVTSFSVFDPDEADNTISKSTQIGQVGHFLYLPIVLKQF